MKKRFLPLAPFSFFPIPGFQFLIPLLIFLLPYSSLAQTFGRKKMFSREDTLRGSITPERAWWDVLRYDLAVTPDFSSKTISGKNTIRYRVLQDVHSEYIQIDLQQPLIIDTIYYDDKPYVNYPAKPYFNRGNVWFIPLPKTGKNSIHSITLCYSGIPRKAVQPPWDGGWIWTRDMEGRPWMSVACQGLGASVWYPCKDHQSDEPDNGASLTVTVPDNQTVVANGKLKSKTTANGMASYTWEVTSAINNYNIVPYIGSYVNWTGTYQGEKGNLDCSYWVMDYNLEKAKKHFEQAPATIKAFEHWFGPFPFYEDGYKLTEAPHLGMEHQSAIAYGNQYMNGYLGQDLSGSGWGLRWDYIIVHESGHEWFGNNITTKDIADMWVHEGFTDYSETLFTEYYYGKKAAEAYVQGIRRNILNDVPVIGPYGVNQEGSNDMYYKGANLIHTVRQVINNDSLFRAILRGLNKTFYHQTITSVQLEEYISRESGKDLSKVFDQYLRTTKIPVLELKYKDDRLEYRWMNCVPGFAMPVKLSNDQWLNATADWQKTKLDTDNFKYLSADPNFYIKVKKGL